MQDSSAWLDSETWLEIWWVLFSFIRYTFSLPSNRFWSALKGFLGCEQAKENGIKQQSLRGGAWVVSRQSLLHDCNLRAAHERPQRFEHTAHTFKLASLTSPTWFDQQESNSSAIRVLVPFWSSPTSNCLMRNGALRHREHFQTALSRPTGSTMLLLLLAVEAGKLLPNPKLTAPLARAAGLRR
jgi:hypothetical protein